MTRLSFNIDLNNNKAIALLNYLKTLEFISFEDSYDLSPEQKKAVDKALQQIRSGDGIPHEQVMAGMKQKFPDLF